MTTSKLLEKIYQKWSSRFTYDGKDRLIRNAMDKKDRDMLQALQEMESETAKEIFDELDKEETGYGDIMMSLEAYKALKSKFLGDKSGNE